MKTTVEKKQDSKSTTLINPFKNKSDDKKKSFSHLDGLQRIADNSTVVQGIQGLQQIANNSTVVQRTLGLQEATDNRVNNKFDTNEKKNVVSGNQVENETGMPDKLKTGIEDLSGIAMDSVKVHYNSEKPSQLQALAYTQGTNIYLGQGQEKHLPHESWHVVQQMQGRVKQNKQVKGVSINDDRNLENEADEMGKRSLNLPQSAGKKKKKKNLEKSNSLSPTSQLVAQLNGNPTITHETTVKAPNDTNLERTDVGVGEDVAFSGSAEGKWTATGGTPTASIVNDDFFFWTAPNREETVTIKLEVGSKSATVDIDVIEPDSITITKNRDMPIPAGVAGVGMELTFNYHPMTVSFGNVEAKEVSGPASKITGYFKTPFPPDKTKHDSGDTFSFINEDNKDSVEDQAGMVLATKPYTHGTLKWKIPNNFRVDGETGDGKEFTKVKQSFTIDPTGKAKVKKGHAFAERP